MGWRVGTGRSSSAVEFVEFEPEKWVLCCVELSSCSFCRTSDTILRPAVKNHHNMNTHIYRCNTCLLLREDRHHRCYC